MALSVTSPALSMHATPDAHVAEVHGKAAAAVQCSLACLLRLVLVCAVSRAVASSSIRRTIQSVALLTFIQVPTGCTITCVVFMSFNSPCSNPRFPEET